MSATTTIPAAETVTARRQAEEAASALQDRLGQGCQTEALCVDGVWYVVTAGTGEGNFAYDAQAVEDLDLDAGITTDDDEVREDIEAGVSPDEARERHTRWDYSTWCSSSSVDISDDVRVAVAYYIETGKHLHVGGSCARILSDRDVEIIDAVEAVRS
jgi:hypothetical protein